MEEQNTAEAWAGCYPGKPPRPVQLTQTGLLLEQVQPRKRPGTANRNPHKKKVLREKTILFQGKALYSQSRKRRMYRREERRDGYQRLLNEFSCGWH